MPTYLSLPEVELVCSASAPTMIRRRPVVDPTPLLPLWQVTTRRRRTCQRGGNKGMGNGYTYSYLVTPKVEDLPTSCAQLDLIDYYLRQVGGNPELTVDHGHLRERSPMMP